MSFERLRLGWKCFVRIFTVAGTQGGTIAGENVTDALGTCGTTRMSPRCEISAESC